MQRLQAVHVLLPQGRLTVSVLAAPRTGLLWPDLAAEIAESLQDGRRASDLGVG